MGRSGDPVTDTITPTQTEAAARAIAAYKIYGSGEAEVRALDGVDIAFERARMTAIMGPSGSGKSTLLHCMAGLDRLTSGQIFLGGLEISALSEKQLTLLRRDRPCTTSRRRSWSSRTTRWRPATPTASCSSPTGAWSTRCPTPPPTPSSTG